MRGLWLVPVGALTVTALLQDLKGYSIVVTALGLLLALRRGSQARVPRSVEPILMAALPQVVLFGLGWALLGGGYPGAAHDAVQAGDKAYMLALFLGGQSLLSLLVSARWPVQRIVARLTLLGALGLLLTTGILGHGRWANDGPRLGGSLGLLGLSLLVEVWLCGPEDEPDLTGLLPAVAAALGPAALFLEAHQLWQGVVQQGVADLAREGQFLLVATGLGWLGWSGALALASLHPRLHTLRPMATYTAGATLLYGLCWFLFG